MCANVEAASGAMLLCFKQSPLTLKAGCCRDTRPRLLKGEHRRKALSPVHDVRSVYQCRAGTKHEQPAGPCRRSKQHHH